MVPISVTGVHNCLSNCFITGEEAWAPSALPPHLDFGKPSPAQMRSLSWVLTCICLLPWFPKSASFICTPILTQTPLMEIPMAGGGGALMAVCWRGELVFSREWMRKEVKNTTCKWGQCSLVLQWSTGRFVLPLSECFCVLSQSLVRLEDPWDFPQETCCPNESSLSNVGRTWGGKLWLFIIEASANLPNSPAIPLHFCYVRSLIEISKWQNKNLHRKTFKTL